MSELSISGARKAYGAKTVLHGLDVHVPEGSFCALLGPSGSGKTTLLQVVAGLEPLDAGTITLAGRDITGLPPERRNIGIVFQNYALFPHLSIADNVAYGLKSRKVPRQEQRARVAEILDLVGLGDLHARKPTQLSGGQQQRVALARALVVRPDLLLLDEPLSALDRKVRGEMQDEIARIHRETGVTTVMVTHDQEEALGLADQVVLLSDGRIQQRDAPEAMYRRPATPFVADFMGAQRFVGEVAGGRVAFAGVAATLTDAHWMADGEAEVALAAEAVTLRPDTASTVTISRLTFLGPTIEAVVQADGQPELRALMLSGGATGLREGLNVAVDIDPAGLQLWPR